jgi:hypothetical protein
MLDIPIGFRRKVSIKIPDAKARKKALEFFVKIK